MYIYIKIYPWIYIYIYNPYGLLHIPYWLFLCLFAFAYAHAMGPRTDGPAAPAHGGGAWARPMACA